jgi:hypothetical protein
MEQVSERSDIDAVIDLGQENSHGLDPFLGCAVRYDALPIKVGLGPHGKLSGKLLVVGDFAQNAIPNWPSGGACAKGGEFLAIEHILLRQACGEVPPVGLLIMMCPSLNQIPHPRLTYDEVIRQ